MHTFLVFFGWPMGAVWGNLLASLLVFMWVTTQTRSIRAVQAEIRDLQVRHHAEHMAALDPATPGSMGAVMSEVKDAKNAAETSAEAMKLLTSVLKPKTPMTRKASPRQGDRE